MLGRRLDFEPGERYASTGSLPGTAAILVRRHDGRNWVVLLNARSSPHSSHLAREIDPLVHLAANKVVEWPDVDLFQ